MRAPKCKVCKTEFIKRNSLQKYCSLPCALIGNKTASKKRYKKAAAPHKNLIKRLDDICREYTKLAYAQCVTCGTKENPTPGHLITRAAHSVRWDLKNLARQCMGCNLKHEHHPQTYTLWFVKTYGLPEFEALCARAGQPDLRSDSELEELYQSIAAIVADLRQKQDLL